jgi:uncharacterized protein (TIGR00369 family)
LRRTKGCFGCGTENEAGLGIALYKEGDRIGCDVSVPVRFRGLTKVAHGGIAATLLDEVIVSGISHLLDVMCVTKEMTVRFRRPLPLEQPVTCKAWVVSREEQRVVGHGEIVDASGTVLVEAECHMQVLDPERAKKFLRDETVQKLGDREPR